MTPVENDTTSPNDWERLIQGDQTALKALYDQYTGLLYNYGRQITTDTALVQDCIHDLFLDLWTHRQGLSHTTAVKPYLYKSLRRKILAEAKKITRQLTALELTAEVEEVEYFFNPSAAGHSNGKDKAALNESMSVLPARQQEVLSLIFFENLTREEVAEVMGVDTRTVYSLTWRAIKSLRKDLVPLYPTLLLGCLLTLLIC